MPAFSRGLEQSLHRALALANERHHEYATLEHLLVALIDDLDALATMKAFAVDPGVLKEKLVSYIDNELKTLVTDDGSDSRPTAGFQRAIQRAVIHVQSSGGEEVTGANVLVAILAERDSQAAALMQEQGMTRHDVTRYVSHGIAKGDGVAGTNDDEALVPAFSRGLEQSLHRALALANERHHEYATLEHLLLALIDDVDALAAMKACAVDPGVLKEKLVSHIDNELKTLVTDDGSDSKPTVGFQRAIQRAVIHVQSSGREKVTGAHVLVAVLAEHESQAAALMQEQGMTRYDVTRYLSHGIAKGDGVSSGREGRDDPGPHIVSDQPPGLLAKVLLLNDDYTPMEFVVHVLERVFDKDHETATRLMLEIHHKGTGTCGIYPHDAADAKVREVRDLAREHQYPLQSVLERSSST
jgi:ATP-dependent Clp protease ATP-binding subunit ClpA